MAGMGWPLAECWSCMKPIERLTFFDVWFDHHLRSACLWPARAELCVCGVECFMSAAGHVHAQYGKSLHPAYQDRYLHAMHEWGPCQPCVLRGFIRRTIPTQARRYTCTRTQCMCCIQCMCNMNKLKGPSYGGPDGLPLRSRVS